PARSTCCRNQSRTSSSSRMVILVLPLGTGTTGPRFAWLKSYSRFIVFLVLPPLARGCWPCGDEPNSLAAPRVNHNQDSAEPVHPDRDPSFFISEVRTANCQREIILEDRYSIGKVDPVFCEICRSLARIPVEGRVVHCMHICT